MYQHYSYAMRYCVSIHTKFAKQLQADLSDVYNVISIYIII